jgi:alpha-galactosidase
LALDGGARGGQQPGIEPVDWLVNTTPNEWRADGDTIRYDWSQPWGADPIG